MKACHGPPETDAPCFVDPPQKKSKFSCPYQITETPYLPPETKKRHKDVEYPQ